MGLPSPTDLQYFLAVAQSGSLTKAAARLAISQPSLTLAMRRLEQSVGAPVFLRTRRGVTLTQAGERLLAEAKDLYRRWEILSDSIRRSQDEVRGRLVFGIHPSVAIYSLPLFLKSLLRDHVDLEIRLVHDLSRAITRKVIDLEIDIGLVVNPVKHPDLIIQTVAKDEVTVWTATGANEDILIVDPDLAQSQFILRRLKRKYTRLLECGNLEVILSLAEAGAGHAILPARVAHGKHSRLKPVNGSPKFSDEICLIYRHEQRNLKSLQALRSAIHEGFR